MGASCWQIIYVGPMGRKAVQARRADLFKANTHPHGIEPRLGRLYPNPGHPFEEAWDRQINLAV